MNIEDIPLRKVDGIEERIEHRLAGVGIDSAFELASSSPYEIMSIVGGDSYNAALLIANARSHLIKKGYMAREFIAASEIARRKKNVLSTGSKALDSLLAGGIETDSITEFYGAFGSGKSQICHTASVLCNLKPEDGGLGGNAIYIDTEGTFRVNRIAQIAEARGLNKDEILDCIFYCRVFNVPHLETVARSLGGYIRKNRIKLVIIDSIINLFRSEFIGREALAERQQKLNALMHKLHNLAEVYDIAVIITNQVQSSPTAYFTDTTNPAGGNILGHGSTYRIYLKRSGNYRIAAIIDSPYHPYSEARFAITDKGVSDTDD
ncbi:MAG: DNA repair and recombination protein RadA [Nitrososphaerota archaeon]